MSGPPIHNITRMPVSAIATAIGSPMSISAMSVEKTATTVMLAGCGGWTIFSPPEACGDLSLLELAALFDEALPQLPVVVADDLAQRGICGLDRGAEFRRIGGRHRDARLLQLADECVLLLGGHL